MHAQLIECIKGTQQFVVRILWSEDMMTSDM